MLAKSENKRTLIPSWLVYKMVEPLWWKVWQFLITSGVLCRGNSSFIIIQVRKQFRLLAIGEYSETLWCIYLLPVYSEILRCISPSSGLLPSNRKEWRTTEHTIKLGGGWVGPYTDSHVLQNAVFNDSSITGKTNLHWKKGRTVGLSLEFGLVQNVSGKSHERT